MIRPATLAVTRTLDATALNAVANHPEVRPWLGGEGEADLGPWVSDPRNVALVTPAGGFVAVTQGEGRYEIHSMFLPDRDPHVTVEAMQQGLAYLFLRTDAVELVTKVPLDNRAALGLVRLGGFHRLCEASVMWNGPERRQAGLYVLTVDRWAVGSEAMMTAGRDLHTWMAAEVSDPTHEDDDAVHDAMVGAAYRMVQQGNVMKGARFYNRYCAWSGYVPVVVLSLHPVVVDLGGGLLVEVNGSVVERVICRFSPQAQG